RGDGVSGGAVEQIFGPPRHRLCSSSVASVLLRTDSHAARGAAIASLFDPCSLTVSTCPPPPMEKFCHTARTHSLGSALVSTAWPPHGGNLRHEGMGSLAGRSNRFLARPDIGSA